MSVDRTVGILDGDIEGAVVGENNGGTVGIAVGSLDGKDVDGTEVGISEGCSVGSVVGQIDGWIEFVGD